MILMSPRQLIAAAHDAIEYAGDLRRAGGAVADVSLTATGLEDAGDLGSLGSAFRGQGRRLRHNGEALEAAGRYLRDMDAKAAASLRRLTVTNPEWE